MTTTNTRRAVTLTEVLIAIFLMGIGLMAVLSLFPLGAAQMAQALQDQRASEAATTAAGFARNIWKCSCDMDEAAGDTGAIPEGLCDGADLLCAECTVPGESTDAHLGWETLRRSLPRVPRILLAHLGGEARAGISLVAGVQVCDDLDAVEL